MGFCLRSIVELAQRTQFCHTSNRWDTRALTPIGI